MFPPTTLKTIYIPDHIPIETLEIPIKQIH